ncbi:unnamed protein product, partial [Brassica oleracea]
SIGFGCFPLRYGATFCLAKLLPLSASLIPRSNPLGDGTEKTTSSSKVVHAQKIEPLTLKITARDSAPVFKNNGQIN